MIWAVILAAGESRRMGTQKLLLPFGETTVVGAVVGTACASRVDRVLAVLGADRDALRQELEPLGIDFAINENFDEAGPVGVIRVVKVQGVTRNVADIRIPGLI